MKFKGFGLGIAKGMAVTLRHFFRKWITTQYPEKRLTVSKRSRGNEFLWLEERCTGCATCAKSCPQGNIEIVTAGYKDNRYIVEKFEIDAGRCMFCGLCVESCPYDALYFGRGFEAATYQRGPLFWGRDKLQPDGRSPSAYAHPQLEPQLPEQTLLLNSDRRKR